jgi:excisionase family DNA binding protein
VATVRTTSVTGPSGPRFLQLADVAEVLNISSAQVYALVRSGELPAIKIGGRGQWRVEASELETYIQRMYEQTREFVSTHQFGRGLPDEPDRPDQPGGPAAADGEAADEDELSGRRRKRPRPEPDE